VTGYFYNPNIHLEAEFRRRLDVARRVAREFGFPLEAPAYDPQEWYRLTAALADEPEGGRRCDICFRVRLERTHDFMVESGAEAFTTTLTIGPRKPAGVINEIGRTIGGDSFLTRDFKKMAGFQRAVALARQWDLYRQDYCGCVYSRRPDTPRD
jgi:predicted adenine nucleotide alpha hydrolase (AANH) superfamily ATPase